MDVISGADRRLAPVLQPQDETGLNALKTRFEAFVEKALREAKLRTDWVDSNEAYETAMLDYARYLLAPDNQTFCRIFIVPCNPSSAQDWLTA